MSVFVIAERVKVLDAEKLQEYLDAVSPTIENFGGRYHVVSGPAEVLEGDWRPPALVVFEFPSHERALEWWDSEEYAPLKALRREVAVYNMVLAKGLE
ncbi:MAG: DUF1330 domain-containing protein [Gaiellaceae bacterium]|jgi:uncharacterized protein (DUF1330 family)